MHRAALTGQQFQGPDVEPVYVQFEEFTHVTFYRRSFFDVVQGQEGRLEGFSHVDDWVPRGWSPLTARTRCRADSPSLRVAAHEPDVRAEEAVEALRDPESQLR